MEAAEYRFVAPDNGVLTPILDDHNPKRSVELSERRYALPTVSRDVRGTRSVRAGGSLAREGD